MCALLCKCSQHVLLTPMPAGMQDAEDPRNQKDEQGKMQLLLLDDVSGAFRPGVLTCLMGASGKPLPAHGGCATLIGQCRMHSSPACILCGISPQQCRYAQAAAA